MNRHLSINFEKQQLNLLALDVMLSNFADMASENILSHTIKQQILLFCRPHRIIMLSLYIYVAYLTLHTTMSLNQLC